MNRLLLLPLAVAFLGMISSASAVTIFAEGVDGELSDNLAAPTLLTLSLGLNTIEGQVGGTGSGATNGSDADFFTFELAFGLSIETITATRSGLTSQSFIGYRADSSFPGLTAGDLDDNALFSNGEVLLPGELGAGPIGSGNQAFWVQETAGAANYTLTFTVVPEPSSLLLGLAACALGFRRRR
ncbi:MAG: PEP-CTERM sorting domain-containing protein [Verrucomicrobiota bacterium]